MYIDTWERGFVHALELVKLVDKSFQVIRRELLTSMTDCGGDALRLKKLTSASNTTLIIIWTNLDTRSLQMTKFSSHHHTGKTPKAEKIKPFGWLSFVFPIIFVTDPIGLPPIPHMSLQETGKGGSLSFLWSFEREEDEPERQVSKASEIVEGSRKR